MFFIVSNAPDTQKFKSAIKLAKDSDLCLIHDAVYLAMEESSPVSGGIYALKHDLSMRGITAPRLKGLRIIDHSEMIDLMARADKVVGIF